MVCMILVVVALSYLGGDRVEKQTQRNWLIKEYNVRGYGTANAELASNISRRKLYRNVL